MTGCRLAVAMLLTFCTDSVGQTTFWRNSTTPDRPEANSAAPVTLGLRFYSEVPGSVTAVRFYKGPHNTGTHIGNLWTTAGVKLATVTFSGETASGWQQENFDSPIHIAANTTYIISYFAPRGHFAQDLSYPWKSLNRAPLRVSGPSPGVHTYESAPAFPSSTWNGGNYWVDLVFVPSGPAPPSSSPPPTRTISGHVSGSSAALTLSGTSSRVTTTDSARNYTFAGLANGSYVVRPSQPGYTFTPATRAVTINGSNVSGLNFTASPVPLSSTHTISGRVTGSAARLTLSGAASGSTTTDGAGNYSFSGLRNGSYVVAASQSGYTFTPSIRLVVIIGANAASVNFTGTAVQPSEHSVSLSWRASTSPNIRGYNVYRGTVLGGAYVRLNASLVAATAYVDNTVAPGRIYYYTVAAVDSDSESRPSNPAIALVPFP